MAPYAQEPDYFNIVIATNGVGKTWAISISHSWMKALAFVTFLLILLTSAIAIDYVGLIPIGHEHRLLVKENENLKNHTSDLRKRLQVRAEEVARYQELIVKLKSITALAEEGAESLSAPFERAPANVAHQNDLLMFANQAVTDVQVREQEMATMWDLLSDRQNFLLSTPTIMPTHGYFSSGFGLRLHPIKGRTILHTGLDIAAPWGTQVFAPADGVVSYAGYESGYGNMVSVDHGYGVITRFAHNSKIFVRTGQKVHRLDVIAAVGSTGHSTGSHLHYEVIVRGMPVDPVKYILQQNPIGAMRR